MKKQKGRKNMKNNNNNNVCAVYSLVDLINTLTKDNFISLDIIECTFDDTYTIKLSWLNGVYSTQNVFSGDELLKDNGKSIADFIQQETGYDVYGDIKEIASCKKRRKVEKSRDEISLNDVISAWDLNLDCGEIIRCVARASYEKDKLYYLKKARWYLNRLIDEAREAELQRQKEEGLTSVNKYCEEDVVATQDMFDYINNAFGAEIFSTKKGEEKNRRP